MDTLVALTAFVRAAELRSLSEAARRLGQTPSAVSRSIARLERDLDARLLNRSTHAVSLTEAGERFYERAARILRDLDDARDVLREMEARPRGLLRVDAPVGFGKIVLGPLLPSFLQAHRDLRVALTLHDSPVDVVGARMDVVIRVGRRPLEGLTARPLATARMVVCGAPSYFERWGTPRAPDDLLRHHCLGLVTQAVVRKWAFRSGKKRIEIEPRGQLVTDNGELLRDAAVAGVGLVQLLDLFIAPELERGALRTTLDDHALASPVSIQAIQPLHRKPSLKARTFIDFVSAELKARMPQR